MEQMSKEEIKNAIFEILEDADFINYGMMTKIIISQLRGKADVNIIKEIIDSL